MAETLSGVVEKIVFHNQENGYCVLRVQVRGLREPVTIVGSLSQIIAGESIDATGDWTTVKNFGRQFHATQLHTTPPHTAEGIVKYLSSGLVRGIGPAYARKIVDTFGEQTLEIIDRAPTQLSQIKGIGPKRIECIRRSWHDQRAVQKIMIFLHSCGVGTARAVQIYKIYGENAIELVRANPYRLSNDIWGVGFKIADDIARNLGVAADSPLRMRAALRFALQEAALEGHVGLPRELLVSKTAELTTGSTELVNTSLLELLAAEELVEERLPGTGECQELVYLKSYHHVESGVAASIQLLLAGDSPFPKTNLDAAISWAESMAGIEFAPAQRSAVRSAALEKLLILTGGPGTGKTTIVRAILDLFETKQLRVALAAPTGRAAKRLAESTGREAKTIHRLLEFDRSQGGFRRNPENPLDIDLLVIDEFSMADMNLTYQLLRAVPPYASVLFVGDVDQLPSVGAGSVLGDLIDSGRVPVVRLTQIHRQAESSGIVRAAHAINQGELPESTPPGREGDFYFVDAEHEEQVIERILKMTTERIPARFGLDPFSDIQILSPMNKTPIGVRELNRRLQESLNPARPGVQEVSRGGDRFRVGDKIIQLRNDPTRDVFNGDIGRIVAIDPIEQLLTALFDGREVLYEFGDLDELQLAYAISIHKSQGSEYPVVIVPVHTQHFIMLRRNLFYTAVTRGKKLVVLVGTRRALEIAVRKQDGMKRYSLLKNRLSQKSP